VDAAPLQLGTQREGFLFYRGVGGFELPLRATVAPDDSIDIWNAGLDQIPALMLFENRRGRIRAWTGGLAGNTVTAAQPTLDSDFASVRADLVGILISQGLFARAGGR
jgi:hypothetical protein